jgi:hypothetical protein
MTYGLARLHQSPFCSLRADLHAEFDNGSSAQLTPLVTTGNP